MTAHILRTARGELIKRFQKRAKTNFESLKKWISHHTELFKWIEPDGGIMCFPRYSMDIPSLDLYKYLLKTQKILINPGIYFNQEGFIRLSYGRNERSLLNALNALEKGFQTLQKCH
jgi:aspartate/methionine/tyrosine aminotransferase